MIWRNFSQAAYGCSWALIFFAAWTASLKNSLYGIAWMAAVLPLAISSSAAVFTVIMSAEKPNRPAQAFILAGGFWFLSAVALGVGVLTGKPWMTGFIFVLFMGAIQLATAREIARQALLQTRLTWYSFLSFQLAIAAVTVALLSDRAGLAARGAVFGITAWIALAANLLLARARVRATAPRR